jgi:hypothetical protein
MLHYPAVIKAYKSDYLGTAYKCLLNAVDFVHAIDPNINYAKILVIMQSSGMGKSKTIDTIAQERILLLLCMRKDLGPNSFGAGHSLL